MQLGFQLRYHRKLSKTETYLICPLNWGLGHATRLIPIIHEILGKNHQVILGGDGDALKVLRTEFPNLKFVTIPDLHLHLKKGFNLLSLIRLSLQLLKVYIKEHQNLKSIIELNKIDIVISDNRYGLWNKSIKCIFITHQLMLKLPIKLGCFEKLTHWIVTKAISKFDECWIPDFRGKKNLSGDLSHQYRIPSNVKFIGPKSRFESVAKTEIQKKYQCVIVLSGTEPQRSKLQEKLINILLTLPISCLLVEGKISNAMVYRTIRNIDVVPHLHPPLLKEHLSNTKLIICRAGYSSLMDLYYLKKKALIIPTPGQTEQEYLAKHILNTHYTCLESNINSSTIESILEANQH